MAAKKTGLNYSEPLKSTVDEKAYPERPYGEAISKEHKAHLKERFGINVTPSIETAADVDA